MSPPIITPRMYIYFLTGWPDYLIFSKKDCSLLHSTRESTIEHCTSGPDMYEGIPLFAASLGPLVYLDVRLHRVDTLQ